MLRVSNIMLMLLTALNSVNTQGWENPDQRVSIKACLLLTWLVRWSFKATCDRAENVAWCSPYALHGADIFEVTWSHLNLNGRKSPPYFQQSLASMQTNSCKTSHVYQGAATLATCLLHCFILLFKSLSVWNHAIRPFQGCGRYTECAHDMHLGSAI